MYLHIQKFDINEKLPQPREKVVIIFNDFSFHTATFQLSKYYDEETDPSRTWEFYDYGGEILSTPLNKVLAWLRFEKIKEE